MMTIDDDDNDDDDNHEVEAWVRSQGSTDSLRDASSTCLFYGQEIRGGGTEGNFIRFSPLVLGKRSVRIKSLGSLVSRRLM